MNLTSIFYLYGIVYIIYVIRSVIYLLNEKLYNKTKESIPDVTFNTKDLSQTLESNKKLQNSIGKWLVLFSIANLIWVCRGIYNYNNIYFTALLIVGYSIPLLELLKMMFKIFSGNISNIKSKDIKEVASSGTVYKIIQTVISIAEIIIVLVIMNEYFKYV